MDEHKVSTAEDIEMSDPKDAEEQFQLAQRYFKGSGTKKDYEKAAEWYGKAFAFPVFRMLILARVIPTFSESSVMLILRLASTTSMLKMTSRILLRRSVVHSVGFTVLFLEPYDTESTLSVIVLLYEYMLSVT